MSRVGVVGVGRMGAPMAGRLLDAGHDLTFCDPDEQRAASLLARGARRAADPAATTAASEVTITSLPTPEVLEGAMLGDRGVLGGARRGSTVIDMSTSLPALARRLAEAGAQRGVDVLDAPVTGGPRGAEAGTLTIMVGGDPGAFANVLPLLELLGDFVRHMGGPGTGQATKLTNNLLAATHMAVLAEAVALAKSEGLDPGAVYEVVSHGTGDSRVLRNRYPVPGVLEHAPASNNWAPLFPVDLIAKDVALGLHTAAEHGLTMPVVEVALGRYRAAQEAGLGGLDYSAVARLAAGADRTGP
ncbi:MAG: NAD(P)-dependent oxidoreductase [Solirubrobacterales bacterium]|nr:NAD(P)-dependent oxidoreductase [Solirubrobacterales bacterium]